MSNNTENNNKRAAACFNMIIKNKNTLSKPILSIILSKAFPFDILAQNYDRMYDCLLEYHNRVLTTSNLAYSNKEGFLTPWQVYQDIIVNMKNRREFPSIEDYLDQFRLYSPFEYLINKNKIELSLSILYNLLKLENTDQGNATSYLINAELLDYNLHPIENQYDALVDMINTANSRIDEAESSSLSRDAMLQEMLAAEKDRSNTISNRVNTHIDSEFPLYKTQVTTDLGIINQTTSSLSNQVADLTFEQERHTQTIQLHANTLISMDQTNTTRYNDISRTINLVISAINSLDRRVDDLEGADDGGDDFDIPGVPGV